jgi:hypothetical protein
MYILRRKITGRFKIEGSSEEGSSFAITLCADATRYESAFPLEQEMLEASRQVRLFSNLSKRRTAL